MSNATRRGLLGGMAASAGMLAGCAASDGSSPDSDGDGVPDESDYAPDDPDVQSKSDLQGTASAALTATPTASPTPTPESTPTPTLTPTPTPSPTPTPTQGGLPDSTNTLTADTQAFEGQSRLLEYSAATVSAEVTAFEDVPYDRAKPVSILYEYPRGDGVAWGVGEPFDVPTDDERRTVSVRLTDGETPERTRLHYMLFVIPADATLEEAVDAGKQVHLTSSDPVRVTGDRVERNPPGHELGDDGAEGFQRRNVEGAYELSFSDSTNGTDWTSSFFVYKSSYTQALDEPRGRNYDEYVALAQKNGFADELAGILDSDAEDNGFTDKRVKVEFVIDFVQNLPYVTDDVSKRFDEYMKTVTETIAESDGDCEDTAIMLTAVLQAEPFGYDTVLIELPGHMASGILGSDDLEGSYATYDGSRYYYIETTGEGWGIGDLPETYEGAEYTVYQV